jgi:hypothetical protein
MDERDRDPVSNRLKDCLKPQQAEGSVQGAVEHPKDTDGCYGGEYQSSVISAIKAFDVRRWIRRR